MMCKPLQMTMPSIWKPRPACASRWFHSGRCWESWFWIAPGRVHSVLAIFSHWSLSLTYAPPPRRMRTTSNVSSNWLISMASPEFSILLSQTTHQHAMAVAEKLRRLIETWQFPGVARPVTISSGTATYPDHGTTRDDLVKAADAGLYAAKQAWRNCVRVASDIEHGRAQAIGKY